MPELPRFGYDPLEGVLLVGQTAIDAHIEAGGESISLADLLNSPVIPDVDSRPLQGEWTRDAATVYGQWLLSVVQQGQLDLGIKVRHVANAALLGVGPSVAIIENRFDRKISSFKEAIGSRIQRARGRYQDWEIPDFQNYARTLHDKIAIREGGPRKLTPEDISDAAANDQGPGRSIIRKKVTLSELNDYLGYPDTRSWEEEDYVGWGAKVIAANDGQLPRPRVAFDTLSKRHRGPGTKAIEQRFRAVLDFYMAAEQRFKNEQAARQKRLDASYAQVKKYVEGGYISPDLLSASDSEVLAMGAKCTLVEYFKEDILKRRYPHLLGIKDPAVFLRSLAQYSTTKMTPGDTEAIASMLDIYDDLFPQDYSHLKVA